MFPTSATSVRQGGHARAKPVRGGVGEGDGEPHRGRHQHQLTDREQQERATLSRGPERASSTRRCCAPRQEGEQHQHRRLGHPRRRCSGRRRGCPAPPGHPDRASPSNPDAASAQKARSARRLQARTTPAPAGPTQPSRCVTSASSPPARGAGHARTWTYRDDTHGGRGEHRAAMPEAGADPGRPRRRSRGRPRCRGECARRAPAGAPAVPGPPTPRASASALPRPRRPVRGHRAPPRQRATRSPREG